MVNTHLVLCTMGRYHSLNKNFEANPKIGEKPSVVWTGIPEDDIFSGTNLDEDHGHRLAVSCDSGIDKQNLDAICESTKQVFIPNKSISLRLGY